MHETWLELRESIAIRPRDLDGNGHVNHAALIELFEAGRWAWMEANSLHHGAKVVPVVTKLAVDYVREVAFGKVVLQTTTHIPAMGEQQALRLAADEYDMVYRLVFNQTIYPTTEATKAAVIARIEVAFIDTAARRPAPLSDFLEQASLVRP